MRAKMDFCRPTKTNMLLLGVLFIGLVQVLFSLRGTLQAAQGFASPNHDVGGSVDVSPVSPGRWCAETWYHSSQMEKVFRQDADRLTENETILCDTLRQFQYMDMWEAPIRERTFRRPETLVFSTMCRQGFQPQVLEPLAGILRDPRFPCDTAKVGNKDAYAGSKEWLLLADSADFPPYEDTRRIFFDAGGTTFRSALLWFLRQYETRGLPLDEIFVWEAKTISDEDYWAGVPNSTRDLYRSKLTRFNGIPIVTDLGGYHNPVTHIRKRCRRQDFCVFKLDVDTPSVEMPIVYQLIEDPGHLSEFYFEHHVRSPIMSRFWGLTRINGTVQYSYDLLSQMRQKGIRAHSWI